MRKRILALFLISVFAITGLTGCGKDNGVQSSSNNNSGQKKEKEAVMGRYMEKEVELPKLDKDESIVKIIQNKNKQFEVFTVASTGSKYNCYQQQEDKTWLKSQPGWLNIKDYINKDINLVDLCLGQDGNYYACFEDYGKNTLKSIIIKASSDGNTSVAIDIPFLKKVEKEYDGIKYYPRISKLDVSKNGNLVLSDAWNYNSLLIFSPQGEETGKVAIAVGENFYTYFNVNGNNIIFTNDDGNIIIYNTETNSIEKTLEYSGKSSVKTYAVKSDGTLLMGDTDGIHRLEKNGTLWETMVDGSLNSMSMPSLDFTSLFVIEGESEEYYAAYVDEDTGYQLKHYVFDKSVSSVPADEITVYSLVENSTIRQAISLFQAKNADVKVNYVVAMGDEAGNVSDYIRSLNTELLSGNGADVLILDGLPIDSYVEKGVLADISGIVDSLDESEKIITNISDYYHEDGKVYCIPVRYDLPILWGKEEALNSSDNLDDIVEYMNESKTPYYGKSTYKGLLENYLSLYLDDLFENGQLKDTQLKSFLQNMKAIAENCKATENDDAAVQSSNTKLGFSDSIFGSYFESLGKCDVLLSQINNVSDTMIPCQVIKDRKFKVRTANQKFIPKGLIALNSASKETKKAKEFISFVLSAKVQDTNLYDGLPVNSSSLNKWFSEDNQNIMLGFSDQEGNMITAGWPSKEDRDEYLKMALEVNSPIETNDVLYNMITENAIPYLAGDKDIDQAMSAIKTKVNTYLAE